MLKVDHFQTGELLTYGQCLDPSTSIETVEEAQAYMTAYTGYLERFLPTHQEALEVARVNINYYAGYFSDETCKGVRKLFKDTL